MNLFGNIVTVLILMVISIGYAAEPVGSKYSLHSVFERYEHQALGSETTGKNVGTIADSIIINGEIYTVNPEQPWAEAVAIRNGEIIRVGSNAEVGNLVGSETKIHDVSGGYGS